MLWSVFTTGILTSWWSKVPRDSPTKPENKAGPAAVRYWPLHVLPALVGSSWAEKQHFNACCGAIWKWQCGGFWMWFLHAFVSFSLDTIWVLCLEVRILSAFRTQVQQPVPLNTCRRYVAFPVGSGATALNRATPAVDKPWVVAHHPK